MGEFIEPTVEPDAVVKEKPKVFTEEFISQVVKKSIDSNEIPKDHHMIFVGAVDENHISAIIGVQRSTENSELKINFIAEHFWHDKEFDSIGAQVIWSHK